MAMERINFNNINFQQPFSLPKPIMQYIILKPSTAKVYQKLIQTCKYIYYKNSAVLVNQYIWNHKMESLVLTYKAHFIHSDAFWNQADAAKNCLSTLFLQNLKFCNLVDLCLFDQTLTYAEYQMLTRSGNVLNFWMKNVIIFYEDCKFVPVEEIMERLRNCVTFKMQGDESLTVAESAFTPHTFQNLATLPSFQNLELFRIRAPLGEQDFSYLTDFLRRNSNNQCVFTFYILTNDIDWLKRLKVAVHGLTEFGQPLEYKLKGLIEMLSCHTTFTIQPFLNAV